LPDIRTTAPLACFRAGQGGDGQTPRAVQLEGEARLPLRVGHVEQVNLWNRAGDVEKRVDATERGHSLIDHVLGSLRLREIARHHNRFCARGPDLFCRAL
jgi:hypothetical protein